MNKKKILFSLSMIAVVAVVVMGATGAFFTDTETSTGNTFTAGAIDLKIDNESYYNGKVNEDATWDLRDLTVEKFFNFTDLKPGDTGEDTISMHVTDNDAWACAEINLTQNDDVTSTEPELEDGDVADTASMFDGELAQNLNFVWWADDGDNVLEQNEADKISLGGGVMGSMDYLANTETTPYLGLPNDNKILLTLSDSQSNFFNPGVPAPLTGATTYYIGKAFCFGTLALAPVATGAGVNPMINPGITCDGAPVNNVSQTDNLMADVTFTAVQSRNNAQYLCPEHQPAQEPQAVAVGANSLETVLANAPVSGNWYFYDDTNDVINNSLGGFVAGPATPPLGTGSAVVNPLAAANSRTLLTNGQFGGTPLANISAMSYSYYQPSGVAAVNEAPYLRFNVDFSGSPLYQKSLVYVPIANGPVTQNAWQTANMATAGAMWVYSGAFWPAGGSELGTTPGTTAKTWASILADYPLIKMHSLFPQIGMRVGQPGPASVTAYLDKFSITIGAMTKTFDFGN